MITYGNGSDSDKARHPIAVAARRAGLSKDVLRAWERRYGAVQPNRTENGRRRYSDVDIERLRLLGRLAAGGRAISELAALDTSDLNQLLQEEERLAPITAPHGRAQPNRYVEACVGAALALDEAALRVELKRALVLLDPVVLLEDVLAPLMVRMGEMWADEQLSPGQERIVTGVVRSTLTNLIETLSPSRGRDRLLVGTLPGQRHELGAMLAAAAAAVESWQVTYLGPELPPDDFAHAARVKQARAIALGILIPENDQALVSDLRRLATLLPAGVALIAGGAGAPSYADVLAAIGATTLTDLGAFRATLRNLQGATRSNGR